MIVKKRDGSLQGFDSRKIREAMQKAFLATGVTIEDLDLDQICGQVCGSLRVENQVPVDIEKIQDTVERALMLYYPDVAKAYVLYRAERAKERAERVGLHPDPNAIADYIHPAKYGRYLYTKKRRETFLETSHRCLAMHLDKFPEHAVEIADVWHKYVDTKRVLPSMRSLQFGGPKIARHNAAMYNCSYTLIDRPRVFQEILYLLLCGCGVGFSAQSCHVSKLPVVKRVNPYLVRHFVVPDSIEGWSDALGALLDSYLTGYHVEFSYEKIRPEGSPLVLSGGLAPGHLPLKTMLERVRNLLDSRQDRHLRPIDCYDIVCHTATAVLSGGIRRSSLICLFDRADEEMLRAKSPGSYEPEKLNEHRAMSNNSAVFIRGQFLPEELAALIRTNLESPYGEPGFIIVAHTDYGTNPCGEIGLDPVFRAEPWNPEDEKRMLAQGFMHRNGQLCKTGFSFCNLCEINASMLRCPQDLIDAAEAAAIIGTLQATYTSFPYLGKTTELIAERDALLGVSMTGMMDRPDIALSDICQIAAVDEIRKTNYVWSEKLNIRTAARLTTIKPSGTASLELGCIGSGIHPHHARRYFRRITANPNEPIARYFRSVNPRMVEQKSNGDWCLVFPVEVPDSALTLRDVSGLELVRHAISTKKHWINPGSVDIQERSPGLTHNVSLTVHFRSDDLEDIIDEIIENVEHISAMSFLPLHSDKVYPHAPREEVTPEDESRWRKMLETYHPVDYSKMVEEVDLSVREGDSSCSAGACEVEHVGSSSAAPGVNLLFHANYIYGSVWSAETETWVPGLPVDGVQQGDMIRVVHGEKEQRYVAVEAVRQSASGEPYVLARYEP